MHFILYSLIIFLSFFSQFIVSNEIKSEIVYLTWQNNPTTTITIQWITNKKNSNNEIVVRSSSEQTWQPFVGEISGIPFDNTNILHRIELTDLQPNTDYFFKINPSQKVYKFRTMPTNLDSPIDFVVGGDICRQDMILCKKMNQQVAKIDPLFVLAGGDLAYAAPGTPTTNPARNKKEVEKWLQWLSMWSNDMVTADGRLIPIIPAIGNHEVPGGWNQPVEQAALYYTFFPGSGYYFLDFADYMTIVVLDTDHTHPIAGEQTAWLKSVLKTHLTTRHKFALYHVPAFPSVRSPTDFLSYSIRKNWVPLFEKYGLQIAFENHDHAYKRTYPLRNEKIHANGILYMGDGAWGVEPRIPEASGKRWYIAKSSPTNFVLKVTVSESTHEIQAINLQGEVFDSVQQIIKVMEPAL